MELIEKEPVTSNNFHVSPICASICRDLSSISKNSHYDKFAVYDKLIAIKWHVHYNTTTNDMNIMAQQKK